MRFRMTSILFVLLLMTFTVRLGDLLVEVALGQKPKIVSSEAFANESGESGKKEDKKTDNAAKDEDKETATREEIPPKNEKTEVKGLEKDPFAPEFSEEEIKVLQSLTKRREQIEQRERDLDQREKLLQAAEKKVDEKIAELAKLRGELETLMDSQQKMEEERIAQLVKIYENMKPKDAANIFNDMDFDVLLSLIDKMSERKVAPIMAAMNADRAREVSRRLAEQRALPKKAGDAAAVR